MPLDKEVLNHAIIQLIAVQHRTTWEEIFKEFGIENKMAFYVILDDVDKLKDTIPRFCKLCDSSVEDFKGYYRYLEGLSKPQKPSSIYPFCKGG